MEIEKVYSLLWQYNELWVECRDVSNYIEGLEYKQKLLKYLMQKDLIKAVKFINKADVEFTIDNMAEFNKINAYCNTRNEKYLEELFKED